jgi:dipeptidyl aminopeptidase/acylaminoacyl peptidase
MKNLNPCSAGVFALCVALTFSHHSSFAAAQAPSGSPDYHPLVEIQNEELAAARSHFKTNILRSGPPPSEWDDLKTPEGAREIAYVSGNLRLKAWINDFAPGQPNKHPAVLFLHGGFDLDTETWMSAKPFRDAGFVVMSPTVRGENGQHGTFTMYYDEVEDVIQAAEFLRSQPFVDATNVFVTGYSVGGTLTLLAAELFPHFTAAASVSGSPDQVLYLKLAKGASRNAPFDLDDPREIQLRSPLSYAASMKCPVRLFYGTEEKYFEFTAPRTAEIARARGVDAEAVAVEGDHGSSESASIRLVLKFFQQQMR